MLESKITRRGLIAAAATGAAAIVLIGATTGSADAYQGNMERALEQLQAALQSLREATPDKGGHKAHAVALIEQAMNQVQTGINFAAERFGD